MRVHTTTSHRVSVVMSSAIAALVIGGATAAPAFAQPGDKAPGNHGKKVGHAKKAAPTAKPGHAKRASKSDRPSSSPAADRGSSNKAGGGHDDDWQAQADPDGMENGGVDQPGGKGGHDPKGWDGNNGSGNDPDCEDDNRGKGVPGHCKDRPTAQRSKRAHTENSRLATASAPRHADASVVTGFATFLLPGQAFAVTGAGVSTAVAGTGTEVLGLTRSAGPALAAPAAPAETSTVRTVERTRALPDTGASAALLAMLSGGLAAVGAGAVMLRRSRSTQP